MALELVCPHKTRERILAMGPAGTGKSRGLLSVAKRSPNCTFHVVDNDDAYARMLEGETFRDVENVVTYSADDWAEHMVAVADIQKSMGTDDWLCVDILSPTWDMVQQHFIEQIFSADIDEYFMEVRRQKADVGASKALGALDGWMDWPVINKLYARFRTMLRRTPGHLYCTAEVARLADENEDRDIRAMFGPYSVKPVGQKRMPHIFQSILYLTKTSVGHYYLTTIKDRERAEVEQQELGDFATDYLVNIAGWKLQKG